MKKTNLHAFLGLAFAMAIVSILAFIGLAVAGTEAQHAGGAGMALIGLAGLVNSNRLINRISGITGVAAGANAVINLPVNRRYHQIVLNVTNAGSAAAVSTVITAMRLVVNGVPIRTITPAQTIAIAQAQGYYPRLGELPIFFSEPYAGMQDIEPNDSTSWDMIGQSSFEIQLTIAGGTTPAVSGWYEYDYIRNTLPDGKLFLQVIGMHSFTQQVAASRNEIVTIPFSNPIRRLWFDSVTGGTISEVQVQADGNILFEATLAQMKQAYHRYGFLFDHEARARYQNATGPANLALDPDFEAITNFDFAYITDPDYRLWKALNVGNELVLRVTSGAAEALTIIAETVPGIYK